jgi:hypothetical protein
MTRSALIAAVVAGISVLGFECNSEKSCVPGLAQSCPCLGGGQGVQTCLSDRTFGPCQCGSADARVSDGPTPAEVGIGSDGAGTLDQAAPAPDHSKPKPDLVVKKDVKPSCTSNTTSVTVTVAGTRQTGATTKQYACVEVTWDGITKLAWEKTYSMAPSPTGANLFKVSVDFIHPTGVWPAGKTYYFTIKSSTACNAAPSATYVTFATVSSSYSVPCSSNIFFGPPQTDVEWW